MIFSQRFFKENETGRRRNCISKALRYLWITAEHQNRLVSVTSVKLKKAGMASQNIVLKK